MGGVSSGKFATDLTGDRFGNLVVVQREGSDLRQKPLWRCCCDCGGQGVVRGDDLKHGRQKTCGARCPLRAARHASRLQTHGQSNSAEFRAWLNAIQRTTNPNDPQWRNYGGRGIRVVLSFEEFFAEVGPRPSPDYSIDRIDNDRDYESGNLRWATAQQQTENRRQGPGWKRVDRGLWVRQPPGVEPWQ